jgi:putative tryptophan/tyrosine transport system substrate-binding protein
MVADCAMMHGTVLVHTCYTKLVILGPGSKLMRRREFIALLGSAAASWPLAAHAQQPGKMWRIGLINHSNEIFLDGLLEGLRELGYVEGQNIIIERRYAEGKAERFQEFAEEMVRLKADIIIVITTPAALAAKKATTTIPILFPTAIDPVGTGVITSFRHPGGNVTGGAILFAELSAKRLDLLKEVVPGLSRTAVVWNAANPANALAWRETQGAARALGMALQPHDLKDLKDFKSAFAFMAQERPEALLVLEDALTFQYQKEIVDFATQQRLPSIFGTREGVDAGGLMSYGVSLPEMIRRGATYVDKILKGAKPGDLPVEQATKFELVINLKTARVLGLSMPTLLLATADEIIE